MATSGPDVLAPAPGGSWDGRFHLGEDWNHRRARMPLQERPDFYLVRARRFTPADSLADAGVLLSYWEYASTTNWETGPDGRHWIEFRRR